MHKVSKIRWVSGPRNQFEKNCGRNDSRHRVTIALENGGEVGVLRIEVKLCASASG
jgi:hypothetical protein